MKTYIGIKKEKKKGLIVSKWVQIWQLSSQGMSLTDFDRNCTAMYDMFIFWVRGPIIFIFCLQFKYKTKGRHKLGNLEVCVSVTGYFMARGVNICKSPKSKYQSSANLGMKEENGIKENKAKTQIVAIK